MIAEEQPRLKFIIRSQYFIYFGVLGIFLPYFNLYCYHLGFSGLQIGGMVDFESSGELPEWVTGGDFGFEASAVCTLAELATCGALFAIWRYRRARTQAVESV